MSVGGPVMAVSYKKPSKINAVSLLFLLIVAGLIYAGVQFGPPYYRNWKARGILAESVNKYYAKRLLNGATEAEFLDQLRKEVESQMRSLGIVDEKLRVFFDKNAKEVGGGAEYEVRVEHPLVKKTTVLYFRPYISETIQKF
jgi:hypothetical protein